jgi:acyl-CoA thioesterase YciA
MSQMALAAGSLASRHAKGKAVVIAADDLRFPGAMELGDELSCYPVIEKQGSSSMTIAVEAIARERDGEAETRIASGRFTFVAIGADGKKREISPTI